MNSGHGTRGAYYTKDRPERGKPGCRCDGCREANRAYIKDWRARRRAAGLATFYGGRDRAPAGRLADAA